MCRILCVVLVLLFINPLYSLKLYLPRIKLKNDNLLADLKTDSRVSVRVIGAIDDGIRINIIFEYRLRRKQKFFLSSDSTFLEGKVSYAVTQNLLEGTYVVKSSTGQSYAFRSRRRYLKQISKWNKLKIVKFSSLKVGASYYLEVRVLIRSTKMYPPFSFLSVFSSQTAWVRSGVIVP